MRAGVWRRATVRGRREAGDDAGGTWRSRKLRGRRTPPLPGKRRPQPGSRQRAWGRRIRRARAGPPRVPTPAARKRSARRRHTLPTLARRPLARRPRRPQGRGAQSQRENVPALPPLPTPTRTVRSRDSSAAAQGGSTTAATTLGHPAGFCLLWLRRLDRGVLTSCGGFAPPPSLNSQWPPPVGLSPPSRLRKHEGAGTRRPEVWAGMVAPREQSRPSFPARHSGTQPFFFDSAWGSHCFP